MVEDVTDMLKNRALNEGTALVCDSLTGGTEYVFDPDGIHRALLNVTTNALDAVVENDNGEVRISIEHDIANQMLKVDVSDNGPGIAERDHDKIFQPFVSAKGNRGTGLGLSVSRKILREHEGDIIVISDGSSGTTFRLEWPAFSQAELAEKMRGSSVADQNRLI